MLTRRALLTMPALAFLGKVLGPLAALIPGRAAPAPALQLKQVRVDDGEWHHICEVSKAGTRTLYVDGTQVAGIDGFDGWKPFWPDSWQPEGDATRYMRIRAETEADRNRSYGSVEEWAKQCPPGGVGQAAQWNRALTVEEWKGVGGLA